jgi:excisionase family DNA binding protein
MTLREAAALLGITPDSLRQAIKRGTLKATKRGRDWWVTRKALEDYRSSH